MQQTPTATPPTTPDPVSARLAPHPFLGRAPCSPAVLSHKCCLSPCLPSLPLYRACIPPLQHSRSVSYPTTSLCKCTQTSNACSLFPCCTSLHRHFREAPKCTDSPEEVKALPTMLSCGHFFIHVHTFLSSFVVCRVCLDSITLQLLLANYHFTGIWPSPPTPVIPS